MLISIWNFFLVIPIIVYINYSYKLLNYHNNQKIIHTSCTLFQFLYPDQCDPLPDLFPFKKSCIEIISRFKDDKKKIRNFIQDKMLEFENSVIDSESLATIEFLKKSLYCSALYGRRFVKYNAYQLNHSLQYKKELNFIRQKYLIQNYNPEVFYFHNGLRFVSNNIKKYIKSRNILDIGSYNGDSFLVLKDYTDKKIYSYDISKTNINNYLKNMKLNHISNDKFVISQLGMSNVTARVSFNECAGGGCQISNGNSFLNLTTIDNEVFIHKLNVGFIKADVEGVALNVIKGGINTLKNQQPVIEMAIYHSFDELFGIFDYLKNTIKNYTYEFHSENLNPMSAGEIALFAYPSKLLKENY